MGNKLIALEEFSDLFRFDEFVYLDLNEVDLFGWESQKSDLVIDSIIKGIEAGDDFPHVPVYRINDKCYSLIRDIDYETGTIEGGHHRAVGHYIANKPLKCSIYSNKIRSRLHNFNIKNILLVNDDTLDRAAKYEIRKRMFPDYR